MLRLRATLPRGHRRVQGPRVGGGEAVGVPAPKHRTRGSAREISLAAADKPWHRLAWDRLAKAPQGATVTVCVHTKPRTRRSQNSQGWQPPRLRAGSTAPGQGPRDMTLPAGQSLPPPGLDTGPCLCLHLSRIPPQAAGGPRSSSLRQGGNHAFTMEPFGPLGWNETQTRGCWRQRVLLSCVTQST